MMVQDIAGLEDGLLTSDPSAPHRPEVNCSTLLAAQAAALSFFLRAEREAFLIERITSMGDY